MPKAPKKKSNSQHRPAVMEGVPEDLEPKVNLSEGQLDEVASKVAEKLLPLFSTQGQQPLPGSSSAPLLIQQSVPVPCSSHEASGEVSSHHSCSISDQIPQGLKQKIWSGEYVNISNLLVPEDNSGQILTIDQQGKISFVPKSSKKIISIDAWTDAFFGIHRHLLQGEF